MIKALALLFAVVALLALCVATWVYVSPLAAIALGIGAWLAFTWYFADDEPLFGRISELRVTFKQVLANAIIDARELFDRVTNSVAVALVSLDTVIVSTPEIKAAVLASQWGLPAILLLNLVTAISARRTA